MGFVLLLLAAQEVEKDLRPLLAKYCVECHRGEKPKARLNLERELPRKAWKKVFDLLHSGEMPPFDKPQPSPAERERMTDVVERVLATPLAGGAPDPGPARIRRLTRVEYNNTLFDLLRLPRAPRVPFDGKPSLRYRHGDYGPRILVDLPADDAAIGESLSLPPFLMERYLRAAEEVVAKHGDRIEPASFAERAFRRPLAPGELERLRALPPTAILVSPDFLFKVEKDAPGDDPKGVRALNDYELATRLSYFLWSSMPDERLLRLAGEGKLRESLEPEVRRMLTSPKASELADGFGARWLKIEGVVGHMPNPALFPAFYEGDAAKAMLVEAVLFFQTIMAEDRSVLDFIDADFMWLNPQISKIYGIAPEPGKSTKGDWTRVALADKRRGGVLTLAAVLTVTSQGSRTSPVRRGKWLLETILGAPPPPPIPEAGAVADEASAADGLSVRKKLEAHRSDPRCASCHARIDPLGFSLETFNAIGQWRERDGADPIEATGPAELKALILAKHKAAFVRCLAEHLLTHALGRTPDHMDVPALSGIVKAVERDGYRFSRLVVEVATSYPFTHRRGREVKDE